MKWIVTLSVLVVMFAGAVVGTVATRRPSRPVATVRVIKLRLSAGGKELARISTPDGKVATMSREGAEQVGLTPSVQADGIALAVAVRDTTTGDFRVVRRHSLARNVPVDVSTDRTPLTVEWLETTTVTLGTGVASGASRPCSTCCVICDGVTFCACEVTTSCGHCCCKEACGCVNEG